MFFDLVIVNYIILLSDWIIFFLFLGEEGLIAECQISYQDIFCFAFVSLSSKPNKKSKNNKLAHEIAQVP